MTITGGSALRQGRDRPDDARGRAARRGGQASAARRPRSATRPRRWSTRPRSSSRRTTRSCPADVKDGVNAALGEAQEALKGTDTAAIKSAMEKLATESQKMGSALYQQPGAEGAAPGADAGAGQQAQRRRRPTTSWTPRSSTRRRTRSDRSATRDERAENGADGERVVVRDRRRIDPETGEVRTPAGADAAPAGAAPADLAGAPTSASAAAVAAARARRPGGRAHRRPAAGDRGVRQLPAPGRPRPGGGAGRRPGAVRRPSCSPCSTTWSGPRRTAT